MSTDKTYTAQDFSGPWTKDNIEYDDFGYEIQKDIKQSPEEYYKQFKNDLIPKHNMAFFKDNINNLINDFEKIGVCFFYLKWDERSFYAGHIDNLKDYAFEFYNENEDKYPNGLIFISELEVFRSSISGKLYLYFNVNPKSYKDINKILTKYFPNKTIGIFDPNDAIIIYPYEQKLEVPKPHHLMYIALFFDIKGKDKIQNYMSNDEFYELAKKIPETIGSKIIYRYHDMFTFKNEISFFYQVYDHKEKEFIKRAQLLSKIGLPKLKSIFADND